MNRYTGLRILITSTLTAIAITAAAQKENLETVADFHHIAAYLVAGLLMFANQGNFLGLNYLSYIKYVHNNWIVALLVAAILQLYTSHRIANELEKEAKKR